MNMQKGQVTLKTVLHEIQEAGTVFSLKFRKADGSLSFKPAVKKNPTVPKPAGSASSAAPKRTDLANIQRNMNKSGALMLYDVKEAKPFEAKIRRLVEFNGMTIFHNY